MHLDLSNLCFKLLVSAPTIESLV